MAGKTVSTHVDEAIADRVKRIAALEDRKVSQVAGAALSLYARLPGEARDALRRLEALGDEATLDVTVREIASVLVRLDYEFTAARLADEVDRDALGSLESEEAILERAVELTRSASSGTPARVRERLDALISGQERAQGEDPATCDGD